MRIGIDARPAAEIGAGIGTYVRELLSEFTATDHEHEMRLYVREPWEARQRDERCRWLGVRGRGMLWNARVAGRASRECDVYLSTSSYLTPWFLTIPSVVVVHDMVAFDRARLPNAKFARVERATIRPALRRARSVIAISESTRLDLVGDFPRAAGKVRVIHDAAQARFTSHRGADDDEIVRRHGVDRPYVLAVGTLEPRKNLKRLIEAFAQLPDDLRDAYDLVLVGARGWDADETFASVARHDAVVRALGYVPDDDLPALYRQSALLAFPSVYEGFGLPVLEAMQSGTPVLAARTSSVPELGGDAVRYVDPCSIADIRDGLGAMLRNPDERRRMSARGLDRSKRFSWAKTAAATLEVLEAAGEKGPR